MAKTEILGIEYDNVTLEEATADLLRMAKGDRTSYVVTPNPEISESCLADGALRRAVADADYRVADGIGVIMASKILGRPVRERVGGADLAVALLPMMEKEGLSLFILGAKPGVADIAAENIRARYPGLRIAGVHHGYFTEDGPVIDRINAAAPDVLFVGLGSPRQENWMHRNRDHLQARLLMGLGGTIDILAGVAKRAPDLFIRLNLEWFYRLLCQPSRFVRMLKLPVYILRAFYVRIFKKQVIQSEG